MNLSVYRVQKPIRVEEWGYLEFYIKHIPICAFDDAKQIRFEISELLHGA